MSSPAPAEAKRPESKPTAPASSAQPRPAPAPNGNATPPGAGDGEGLGAALASEPTGAVVGTKDRSNAIDKGLEDDSKKFKRECKILLLGGSPSRLYLVFGSRDPKQPVEPGANRRVENTR